MHGSMPQDKDPGFPCFLHLSLEFRNARVRLARSAPLDDAATLAKGINSGKGRGIVMAAGSRMQVCAAADTYEGLSSLGGAL